MKLYKTLLASLLTALAALGLTACNGDLEYAPAVIPETMGNGTSAQPYNVGGALKLIYSGEYTTQKVFVHGIVSQIDTSEAFNPSYGNITYYISDDGEQKNELEIYRGLGLDGAKFNGYDDLSVGDEVIIYCQLTYYNNSVAETAQGAILVSINGSDYEVVEPVDPAGEGTAEAPYNVKAALDLCFTEDFEGADVYVAGTVSAIESIDLSYGNATYYISDSGSAIDQLEIYRGNSLNGNKFTSTSEIKVGDKIIVYGTLVLFSGNTPEFTTGSKIVSINGSDIPSTPETPDTLDTPSDPGASTGDGTESSPWNVAKVMSLYNGATGETGWVEGYIVGTVTDKSYDTATFSTENASNTNIILAGSPTETNPANCIPVQLPAGDVRNAVSLQKHPENLGKKVQLLGTIDKYFGTAGFKTVTAYKMDGSSTPTTPDTPDTPSTAIYSGLTANMDGWTIDNVELGALDYVWAWKEYNGNGYLNGSAYKDSAVAAEAYCYTALDLSAVSKATLTFDHTAKFQTTLKTLCSLVIREQGKTEWTAIAIPVWPEAGNWTFVSSGDIDLSAYAGKKVEIGFKYGSTASGADTWEIKNFIVK